MCCAYKYMRIGCAKIRAHATARARTCACEYARASSCVRHASVALMCNRTHLHVHANSNSLTETPTDARKHAQRNALYNSRENADTIQDARNYCSLKHGLLVVIIAHCQTVMCACLRVHAHMRACAHACMHVDLIRILQVTYVSHVKTLSQRNTHL